MAHVVETAYVRGWSTVENGKLPQIAEAEGFDVFVTTDRKLQQHQNLAVRSIAMSSRPLGESTFPIEVTSISAHGIWLAASVGELFLPYEDSPCFKNAPVAKILNVEGATPDHFYWPELDVDLTAEIIEHPDRFPLTAK